MKKTTHLAWVEQFTRSMHQAWVGMVPGDWGPLDFNTGHKVLNGAFIKQLHEAVVILKNKKVPLKKVAGRFLSPSAFRAAFYFAVYQYARSDHSLRQEAREVFDYLQAVLETIFVQDFWALESNVIHTPRQVKRIVENTPWMKGNPEASHLIARLGNSASALAYALYRDYYVDESQEVYGPYNVSNKEGRDRILVIKHYPKMRPLGLWPSMKRFKYTDIKLYMIYEGVKMRCEFIGMHTLYEGDLMGGLRKYAVEIDGVFYEDPKKIKRAMIYIGKRAVKQWSLYEKMSKKQIKMKFLEWMCFSCAPLLELAGVGTHPSDAMVRKIMGAKLRNRCVVPSFPPYESYLKDKHWEVYWLRDLYKT